MPRMLPPLMLLCVVSCSRSPGTPQPQHQAGVTPAAPAVALAPRIDEAEGHGGIAVVDPAGARLQQARGVQVAAPPQQAVANETAAPTSTRELYLRAYAMRASDPAAAVRLFQRLVDTAPVDDEFRIKALRQLSQP